MTEPILKYKQDQLPPLNLLVQALHDPGIVEKIGSVDRVLGMAQAAAMTSLSIRVWIGAGSRFFRDEELNSETLKTLDEGRHISSKLVCVLAHLIWARARAGPCGLSLSTTNSRRLLLLTMDFSRISSSMIVQALQWSSVSNILSGSRVC